MYIRLNHRLSIPAGMAVVASPNNNRRRNVLTIVATALVGTVMLGAPSPARAELAIFAQEAGVNGGNFTLIAGTLGTGSDFGVVFFTGTYGDFKLTLNGASSNNGSALSDLLGSTNRIENTAGSTRTIQIAIVQTNYTLPPGVLRVESGMGGSINAGTVGLTGIFQAAYNTDNSATSFPLTNGPQNATLTGTTFDTGSAIGTLAPRTGTTPYAVSSLTTLAISGGGILNYSSHVNLVSAVPEPATVAMALTALPLLGLGAWTRRRRAQA